MRPHRGCLMFVTLILAGAVIGCDNAAPPAPTSTLPAPVFGAATIAGHVHFVGTPPERKMIDTTSCQAGSNVQQEETVVVTPEGGLRDVIVYLKDAPATDGSAASPAVLDQVGCRYVPHALAVQVGQPLKITTSDPMLHNVHYTDATTGDQNFGMSHPGESKTVTFDQPQFVQFNCNVHPWMHAIVGVVASPFFAVTAADGGYTIDRVPAGHYTIAAWHPILGERTAAVDVGASGEVKAAFEFGPPGKK